VGVEHLGTGNLLQRDVCPWFHHFAEVHRVIRTMNEP
jgi:hypothetical protein